MCYFSSRSEIGIASLFEIERSILLQWTHGLNTAFYDKKKLHVFLKFPNTKIYQICTKNYENSCFCSTKFRKHFYKFIIQRPSIYTIDFPLRHNPIITSLNGSQSFN